MFLVTPDLSKAIQNSQVLPFRCAMKSDHRAVILDLDAMELLGNIPDDITKPSTRNLRLTCPSRIERYASFLIGEFQIHNIESRVKSLSEKFSRSPKKAVKEYDTLSRTITNLQRKAEKHCGNKTERLKYSPTISKLITKIRVIKVLCSRCRRNKPLNERLIKEARELHLEPLNLQMNPIRAALNKAYSELRGEKKRASTLREQHLQQRSEFYSEMGDRRVEQLLNTIKNAESSRNMFKKIKSATHSLQGTNWTTY